jgi:hypothetical protein
MAQVDRSAPSCRPQGSLRMECVDVAQRTVTSGSQAGLIDRRAALVRGNGDRVIVSADGPEADPGARRARRDTPYQSGRLRQITASALVDEEVPAVMPWQGHQRLTMCTRTSPAVCSTPTSCRSAPRCPLHKSKRIVGSLTCRSRSMMIPVASRFSTFGPFVAHAVQPDAAETGRNETVDACPFPSPGDLFPDAKVVLVGPHMRGQPCKFCSRAAATDCRLRCFRLIPADIGQQGDSQGSRQDCRRYHSSLRHKFASEG